VKRHSSFTFPVDPREREQPARETGGPLGSGRWAQMARAVGLATDAPVLVALSGGADSVYLVHVVAASKPRPRLLAVHVEHGLRGEEGREDAAFCARLAASLCVPFVRREIELVDAGPSLEARARAARYQALCEEAARAGIASIVTGHHADDALETLLQRWMRGTDVHGLGGLRKRLVLEGHRGERVGQANERLDSGELNPTGVDVQIVRPLIAMRREEVRRILSDADIRWREDGSNASPRFTRNRIRNQILPAIEATCGPEAVENLRAFGAAVEALEERCASLTAPLTWAPPLFAAAGRAPAESALGGTLSRQSLLAIPSALRRRAIWRLLVEGTGRAPAAPLLGLLLADLAAGRTTRRSLPGGWSLHLRSDLLHLQPPVKPADKASIARGKLAPEPAESPVEAPPQLELPFAFRSATRETSPPRRATPASQRLDLPGLVTLADGRQITAEIVYLPVGTDVLRSGSAVEIDARDFLEEPPWAAPSLWVRFPIAGDRFQALGAPGGKALSRFLADAGVPREDRGRVPLVFAGDELVWVAGIRPCESRRVRPDTEARLRLCLHVPIPPPKAKSAASPKKAKGTAARTR
jgi:tRNA(Ile)-lysidine synthase